MRLWLKMKILSKYERQTKFARACGKSDDWISKIIVGRSDPSEQERALILLKLGIDHGDDCKLLFAK